MDDLFSPRGLTGRTLTRSDLIPLAGGPPQVVTDCDCEEVDLSGPYKVIVHQGHLKRMGDSMPHDGLNVAGGRRIDARALTGKLALIIANQGSRRCPDR